MMMRQAATGAMRALRRRQAAPRAVARFSTASAGSSGAGEAAKASGPPFLRYFLYTTGIMFGIPGAIGAVFVYNLKTDDEFYAHFNERYPELIAAINAYVPLDAEAEALASRTDIGSIESTELLQQESMCNI